jgi:hypothetical protein
MSDETGHGEKDATQRMREAMKEASEARNRAVAALARARALLWVAELGMRDGEPSLN